MTVSTEHSALSLLPPIGSGRDVCTAARSGAGFGFSRLAFFFSAGAFFSAAAGTYCSEELNLIVTKICIEHTKSYCCYNSRLARIINEQGRGQIGKGWGGAESPQCGGFTQAEFAQISDRTPLSPPWRATIR